MDTFKTMEGERIEQLERDKVALMAEIQELKRENARVIATLENRLSIDGDEVGASDAYWEIADITNTPEGGSVVERVNSIIRDRDKWKADQQSQRDMKYAARRQRDKLAESLPKIKADAIREAVSIYTHKITDEFCEVQVNIMKKGGGFLYPEGLIDYANKLEEGLQDEIE